MGAFEASHSTIAYSASRRSRLAPGQFFINVSEPGTRPRYEAEALAYHEAVRATTADRDRQELPHLPEFRRHLGPTPTSRAGGCTRSGWQTDGPLPGDLDRLGVLSFDAWRAARLVVDTGMHALGWSRQQAIAFMLDHSALAPNNIVNEVDRYIVLPGQALAYKTGQLELLRLRAEARERMGATFDIRGFHDAVLGSGRPRPAHPSRRRGALVLATPSAV